MYIDLIDCNLMAGNNSKITILADPICNLIANLLFVWKLRAQGKRLCYNFMYKIAFYCLMCSSNYDIFHVYCLKSELIWGVIWIQESTFEKEKLILNNYMISLQIGNFILNTQHHKYNINQSVSVLLWIVSKFQCLDLL